MGLGQYFFELKAHVSQNGVIVGLMMEALVGRMCLPEADDWELSLYCRMRHTR